MDTTILLLFASLFLISVISFAVFLPRLLRAKPAAEQKQETDLFMSSLQQLSGEIKSLKEQLSLKEQMAVLGEVSAGIAHELRNPMGVISGYGSLLMKSLDEKDDRRQMVQNILEEVNAMNTVIEELLRFSRPEPINRMQVDIAAMVKSVADGMRAPQKKITVTCVEPFIFNADEALLRQAVRNLLQNALDCATEVHIDAAYGLYANREGCLITVRDNGKGISQEDLGKIFSLFFTTKERGIGIGLPLAQKIAMVHGGMVTAKSVLGYGSTFYLFLPK